MRALPVGLLLVLAVALGLWVGHAGAEPGPAAPARDARGWKVGPVAAGMADVLTPAEAVPIDVPAFIAARVEGPTILFYFAPSCPHCRDAMPDIHRTMDRTGLPVLGIAVSRAPPAEVAAFEKAFAVRFPVVIDTDRAFADAVSATSTPTVYVVSPSTTPGTVLLEDAYTPFVPGAGSLLHLRRNLAAPFAAMQGYQGRTVCHTCHTEEARSWLLSNHALAYHTLNRQNRLDEPKCVRCHVTGMGEPDGFAMGEHTSALAAVGCEACHGPSGPHDGQRTDARSTCVGCHDAEHSVAFHVDKGLPHIDHFAAVGLSEAELTTRLRALASGDLERPLLAFPEGPTTGAAACKACHGTVHKAWRKDPHAGAMATLEGDDATDPTCVRCHATATAVLPAGHAVTSWRTDEGVGCEACHGPGTAHLADPRADNIVGLSDSCPECVIEAICTRCHTPKWDPRWDLRTRLSALSH